MDDGVQATFSTIRPAEIATIMSSALSQFPVRITIQEMNTLNQVGVELDLYVRCSSISFGNCVIGSNVFFLAMMHSFLLANECCSEGDNSDVRNILGLEIL